MSVRHTLVRVDIPVADLDRAFRSYTLVFGRGVTKEGGEGFAFGLLPHGDDNVSGCLATTPDNAPSERGPLVYLNVEGRFDRALQAVNDHGGAVLVEKHPIGPHGWRAVIRDTEGNRVALHARTEG